MSTSMQKPNILEFNDKDELHVRIWEKVIDVQKHFNEIKSKNQTLFISILTACLAGTGYLMLNKSIKDLYLIAININDFHFKLYLFSLPVLGAIIFTICFYILDHSIYHVLLKGAVECGKEIELEFFNRKLSSHIINEVSREDYLIKNPLNKEQGLIKGAGKKHQAFYRIIIGALSFFFVILTCFPIKY